MVICARWRFEDVDVFDPDDQAEDKREGVGVGLLSHTDFRYVFLLLLEQACGAEQMIESLSLQSCYMNRYQGPHWIVFSDLWRAPTEGNIAGTC
jgi:hypothetical protein